jgi:hypothetical protein
MVRKVCEKKAERGGGEEESRLCTMMLQGRGDGDGEGEEPGGEPVRERAGVEVMK